MIETLEAWLAERGLDPQQVIWAMYGITSLGAVLAAWLANAIAKKVLVRLVSVSPTRKMPGSPRGALWHALTAVDRRT